MRVKIPVTDPFFEETKGRECGSCRLCCKLVQVRDEASGFFKPAGQWCRHACEAGCELHGTDRKPAACIGFNCLWLQGMGEDKHKPLRTKVVAFLTERVLPMGGVGRGFELHEAWPGVTHTGPAKELLEKAIEFGRKKGWPVVVVPASKGTRTVYGPNGEGPYTVPTPRDTKDILQDPCADDAHEWQPEPDGRWCSLCGWVQFGGRLDVPELNRG